jgi:hypothetical protein
MSTMAPGILRHSRWDALLIFLSLVHGAVLLGAPPIAVIAVGLWWNSNTISHNFIHLPFFRARVMNRAYSLYLTLVLGFPQSLWRERHLAHHRQQRLKMVVSPQIAVETTFVLLLWLALLSFAPQFFLTIYLPGYFIGLALCYLHGYFEHLFGVTSHYGSAYNLAFFNDGYHIEHHAMPGTHWTQLAKQRPAPGSCSRWPAVLRWIEVFNLETLERVTMRLPSIRWFLLATHRRAFAKLLPRIGPVARATIVGGGLFPRTAIVLRELLPDVELTILDASAENIAISKTFLNTERVCFRKQFFDMSSTVDTDLLVIPLALVGDRAQIYNSPPARATVVHDWFWSRRGEGVMVSWLLLKRMNIVRRG